LTNARYRDIIEPEYRIRRGGMMAPKRFRPVWVSDDTHRLVKIEAAKRRITQDQLIRTLLGEDGMDKLLKLAREIHGEVCDCDDKRCPVTGEIYDWLTNGDLRGIESVESLAQEWREYNGEA